AVPAFAQLGELRGMVFMEQNGQKVPLADARIDVFRLDQKGQYETKTNKNGEFVFAGLPFVGDYAVAASHPTARPNYVPGIKAGRDMKVEVVVTPGDGKRFTYDEVKAGAVASTAAKAGGESEADKAKREELMKKNAEIEAANKKISESNEVIARTFKAGNEALTAGNTASQNKNTDLAVQKYTEAVSQYDEGLAADPEQPAILTNRAVALKARGVQRYNSAITSKTLDDAGRTSAIEAAKADFKAAADASTKAVRLLKGQNASADPAEADRLNKNKYAALLTHAESMRLFVSKVDGTQADAGLAAFKDYMAIETDAAKKAKAQLDAAQMLLDSGAADKALAEFQAVLAKQPDSPEANLGAGLSLYSAMDKDKYQEAANYLQRFVDVAPDSNPMKDDAKAILAELKSTEKIVPEKPKPAPRRRP
ncbi:MAG TPA: carboxypeptidase regulatory-like domain-containing protein, partial [Pyrinomonadaceae bacterium]|nr:carboxypeptidase regulatory-like domain-containing protein [Pyrinomonadaceae bacterium]